MSFITNTEGNYFFQTERRNPFKWLTCTGVGDINKPEGDSTPQYCPDPMNSGKFKIDGSIKGEPGFGTYSLTKPIAGVANFLLDLNCDMVGRINWVCRGQRQNPRNYEFAVIMLESDPTGRGITGPVRGGADSEARVNTTMNLNFTDWITIYHLSMARQAVDNVANANGVWFFPQRCEDRCGPARGLCEMGIMGLDGAGGYLYDSEIKKTFDGDTWAATPTDPFTYGGNVHALIGLETVDGERYLVFRGEGVVGHPAEGAYSDDHGVTWTNTFIGAVNGQYITDVTISGAKIFVTASGGYIYKSENSGQSFTAVESAVETTETLNAIVFYDDQNGYVAANANVFLYSTDGGEEWNSGTGPAAGGVNLLSIAVNDKDHVFIGTNDARLMRTEDGKVAIPAWEEWLNLAAGSIDWIEFDEFQYIGCLIHNTAAPRGYVYISEDGGADWAIQGAQPINAGLNDGHMCDANHVVVVGNVYGAPATTFVAKLTPST